LLDLLDLDRVEVLRGPQGTLEGMNSEGGAIKLFSKAPSEDREVDFDALYGSRNHVEFRGMANFSLIPNTLLLRISGVGNHQDGYVNVYDFGCANPSFTATATNGVTGTYSVPSGAETYSDSCEDFQEGGTGYTGGRAFLRWVVNDNITNDVVGDITNQSQELPATTLLYAGPGVPNIPTVADPYGASYATSQLTTIPTTSGALLPFNTKDVPEIIPGNKYASYWNPCMPAITTPSAIPGLGSNANEPAFCEQNNETLNSWGAADTLNWAMGSDFSLMNILSERGYYSYWNDGGNASPWPAGEGIDSIEHHQFSEELRFNGKWGSLMDFTVGGFYFRELTTYATHQDLWYALNGIIPGLALPGYLDFLQDDPVLAHDRAGFVHTVWHLASKLDATIAGRFTSQDKTYDYTRLNPQGGLGGSATLVDALNGVVGKYSANRWDYRGDLDYHFTDQVLGYGQVSTGFKGGGVNPRPFYAEQAIHFDPETLTTYEMGLKSQWLDNHVRANLDGYFAQYRNIQETLLDCAGVGGIGAAFGSPCALPFNAGAAHEKGVELETEARYGGFELDGSMSYLDFHYVSLLGYDNLTGQNLVSGITPNMTTPYTPKWQGNLGAQYTFTMGNAGSLIARIDANTRSGVYANPVNTYLNYIGGYTTYNAHLTYQPIQSSWQVTLQALNFTDKFYYLNIFDLTQAGSGAVNGTPAPPTEVDLEVKYSIR